MGILTNASKSTIGLFDKNALRVIVAINQSREFNYDHWYKIEKERERRVKKKVEDLLKDKSVFDLVKMVGKEAFNESRKWVDEVKEEYDEAFKLPILEHGAFEYLFKFNKTEDIDKWHITTDSSYKIGKSRASLTLTQNNTALFTGFISPEYDKPERTKAIYTGFANMSSVTRFKSFKRETRIDLKQYTHFLVRARGDGRSYMLVLNTPDYHTLTFTYMHSYPLFTRGGPYWQLAKIPFSKFFHVTHSRVSDRQFRFVPDRVKNIGVTCMDGVPGPFHLELDFIGVVKDNEFKEDIAYETYRIPKYVANT